MRTRTRRIASSVLALGILGGTATGCYSSDPAAQERQRVQEAKARQAPGLELTNLAEKRKREEDPNAIMYVYLTTYGQPVGYYIAKGKISSNGSQMTPEQSIVYQCDHGNCSQNVVDGPQDDGSFGSYEPGIFFFTTDGKKIVTNYDYQYSDYPLPLPDYRKLGGQQ